MTTNPDPLMPLADAIADRVWVRLQEKFVARDAQLVSVPTAARKLGISKTKLRSMIGSGEFPEKAIRRIGRRVMVAVSEMDRWASAQ